MTEPRPGRAGQLSAALAKIDAEVQRDTPLRYAPAYLRGNEMLCQLTHLCDLARRVQQAYPVLKEALQGHPDLGQTCRIVHAACLMAYFAQRLEEVSAPVMAQLTEAPAGKRDIATP
jgi:hypothetical protein